MTRSLAVTALVLLAALAIAVPYFRNGSSPPRSKQADEARRAGATPVAASHESAFVGSQACKSCHEEIFAQYQQSSMGRSLTTVDAAHWMESFENASFAPVPHQRYTIAKTDEGMAHRETTFGADGEPICEQEKRIEYVLGSGKRGRSYLIHEGSSLFQSSVGWYANGNKWDLSPGYNPNDHDRFSRMIGDGCLYCHSGRTNPLPGARDRYQSPVFHELAIGCERCHGPGERHVAFHSGAAKGQDAVDDLVNPAKLEPHLRDSVCNQCHVLGQAVIRRRGKEFFSFRPGESLENVFVMLNRIDTLGDDGMKAVSQVEQMQSSRCYQESDGAMSCVSCHDPHSTPTPESRVEFFRGRCLQCHQDRGCSETETARLAEDNSCIACHMPKGATSDVPHTSLTQHQILRRSSERTARGSSTADADPLVFGDSEKNIPSMEIERAKGVAAMTAAWQARDKELATSAVKLLLKSMPVSPEPIKERLGKSMDAQTLEELASGYYLLDDGPMAEACWTRVLELQPLNQNAMLGLANIAWGRRDLEQFRHWIDKLGELSPPPPDYWQLRIELGLRLQDAEMVIDGAEKLLAENPLAVEPREFLIQALVRRGDDAEADKQRELAKRLREVRP